jgi:hypothetical protein
MPKSTPVKTDKPFGHRSYGLKLMGILLSTCVLVSCHPKSGAPNSKNDNTTVGKENAQNYLDSILQTGESSDDLVKKFGPPKHKFETQTKELCLLFYFSDQNQIEKARAAGILGFSAYFISNRLTSWEPISGSQDQLSDSATIKPAGVAFQSDHAVLTFYLVSQEQKDGFVYVDTPTFPKLGYINNSPDIAIQAGQYIVYDTNQQPMHDVELFLSREDAAKLKKLTSENFGKRMALCVGSRVILAPNVTDTIPDGDIRISLPEQSFLILTSALKANTK